MGGKPGIPFKRIDQYLTTSNENMLLGGLPVHWNHVAFPLAEVVYVLYKTTK